MIQITEDIYLQEIIFVCLLCGTENYSYYEEHFRFDHCIDCQTVFKPNPFNLRDSKEARLKYHFLGKDAKDAKKEKGVKVHTCSYSPY